MKTAHGHLTYCTNIHAGENWPDHFAALQLNFPVIKNNLSPNAPMGIGLRLSNIASEQILQINSLDIFKEWLAKNDAYVFTMNGFPYGGFHNTVVKEQVHAPDWTTIERVDYTRRLFTILNELLPVGFEGSISTSPLSYRYWFGTEAALVLAKKTATDNVLEIVEHLVDIYNTTGKLLHLDLEPEPDGILETGAEFIMWYKNELLTAGIGRLAAKYSITETDAEKLIKRHVCLCYDVCHFAIGFEPHEDVIKQLAAEEIRVGKIQISAALKAEMPADTAERLSIKNAFASFNEATYLHQVIAKKEDESLLRYRDLPAALLDAENPFVKEWRAHFHVPIFEKSFGVLSSTQSDIVELLNIHKRDNLTPHLEVETYTWEVLSDSLKLPIAESISRELKWVANQLSH